MKASARLEQSFRRVCRLDLLQPGIWSFFDSGGMEPSVIQGIKSAINPMERRDGS